MLCVNGAYYLNGMQSSALRRSNGSVGDQEIGKQFWHCDDKDGDGCNADKMITKTVIMTMTIMTMTVYIKCLVKPVRFYFEPDHILPLGYSFQTVFAACA